MGKGNPLMTSRRSEPLSAEVRRQRQLQCIRCDLNTIKVHAARINAIIDLEGLPVPKLELQEVRRFCLTLQAALDRAEKGRAAA